MVVLASFGSFLGQFSSHFGLFWVSLGLFFGSYLLVLARHSKARNSVKKYSDI